MSYLSVSGQKQTVNLYETALEAYRDRRLDDAFSAISEALRKAPDAAGYYLCGLIQEARDVPFAAIADYETALRLNPEFHEATFQKAVLYLQAGDYESALRDFKDLIEEEQAYETHGIYFQSDPAGIRQVEVMTLNNLRARLYFYRGQANQHLNYYQEARADYQEALTLETSADVWVSLGLLHQQNGYGDSARQDFRQAIALDTASRLAWYNLALLDDRLEIPESVLRDESFTPILILLGARAAEGECYEEALRYYNRSLENDHHHVDAWISRGRVYLKLRQYEQAREDFFQALACDESRHEAYYLLGNASFLEGDYRTAISFYNRYLAVNAGNAMIWYNGAMCYMQTRQTADACHYLDQAAALGMDQAAHMKRQYCQ